VSAKLRRASSGLLVYAVTATASQPPAAAAEISDLVKAYFRLIRKRYWNDRDTMPWISSDTIDIRAMSDFLLGVEYVYKNEPGGRHAMAVAIEKDPDFVAPRVWRTPTMVSEEDAATLAAHRDDLERLYPDATDFERAMIRWAIALIDQDSSQQVVHLQMALDQEPGNRPTLFVLGLALMDQNPDRAWSSAFAPLLAERWEFPGFHPTAAECARRRNDLEGLRRVADAALALDAPEPSVVRLADLLAILDGETDSLPQPAERAEGSREPSELDLAPFARMLAERAESEGSREIAARLREFAG
jgi:hypothetical protein